MPPHLHPKSLSTASLFTTTLFLAFGVVAAPHVLPSCPAPARRNVRADATAEGEGSAEFYKPTRRQKELDERDGLGKEEARKCPIPRGGGLVSAVFGGGKEGKGKTKVVFVEGVERAS